MAKKFFDYILQGSEATEENAFAAARGLDWQEVETHVESYPDLDYVDTVNGVGIWYAWKVDSYYFTDETPDMMEAKKIQISKEQLQQIIREGVQNLHKKTLLENERKELNKELLGILMESEVATSKSVEIMLGYLEAALWTEEDEVGHANIHTDISDDSKIDAYQDVKKFMNQAGDLIDALEPSQVGHDLWLTRNGHGAGFWDRGLGEVGDKLSDIARSMGSKHLYRGDDGQIHID